ncbi:MAG: type II secretion system F family protein [Planctomycetaceae bacterium]|nr:type II secretion system F family protein [Planctomycetaceae bacterium]
MADSRVNVYHNLSIMLNAGLPIMRAIQNVAGQGSFGRLFRKIEPQIATGMSLTDIVPLYRQFEPLDRVLITVGEQTGQSAEMFEMLSQWYAFRQRLSRTMLIGMILPLFYIHAASILIPVVPFALGGWNWAVYFKLMFLILAIFYIPGLVILGIVCLAPKKGILRSILDTAVIYLPAIGKGVRELALSRYCKVFAITYKAGVPIVECARMASESVGNQVMRRRLEGGYVMAKAGEEMSKGFSRFLPAEFLSIWQVGEESGELDESAGRLGDMYAENAERTFGLVSRLLPFGIYLIVILVIAYFIVTGFMKIFDSMYSI